VYSDFKNVFSIIEIMQLNSLFNWQL